MNMAFLMCIFLRGFNPYELIFGVTPNYAFTFIRSTTKLFLNAWQGMLLIFVIAALINAIQMTSLALI